MLTLLKLIRSRIRTLHSDGTPPLRPLWIAVYNRPLVPYTTFNNTVLLGSVVSRLVLAAVVRESTGGSERHASA